MAVYVDSIRPCIPTPNWRWDTHCHLVADTLEELHEFARDTLGFPRKWFQAGSVPHYDLTASVREWAIKAGAQVIQGRRVLEIGRKLRAEQEEAA